MTTAQSPFLLDVENYGFMDPQNPPVPPSGWWVLGPICMLITLFLLGVAVAFLINFEFDHDYSVINRPRNRKRSSQPTFLRMNSHPQQRSSKI